MVLLDLKQMSLQQIRRCWLLNFHSNVERKNSKGFVQSQELAWGTVVGRHEDKIRKGHFAFNEPGSRAGENVRGIKERKNEY